MPFTRAQAESLLNQREMGLFDDSRANALRKLDPAGIQRRIERTREARDRARDLLQRQKLATRDRTGTKRGTSGQANQRTKRKAELLGEILTRFRTQLPLARKQEREAAAVARSAPPARRSAAAAKKTARKSTKKGTSKAAAAKGKAATAKSTARVTPRRALAKTRKLLTAKQTRDQAAQAWQTLPDGRDDTPAQPGYQSRAAARKAQELHAGQSRMAPIHGSISTRDRRNQGKRDHRGGGDAD